MPGPACPPNKSWLPNAWKWILRNTRLSVNCCNKTLDKQLEKERVISPHLKPITKEVKAGQEPGGSNRSWSSRRTLVAGSVCFYIAPRTVSLGVAPPTVSCTLPHQSSVKKILHRLTHRPIWRGHFFQRRFPFPNNSSSCWADIQQASTLPNIYF